jgi:hypothetical protein
MVDYVPLEVLEKEGHLPGEQVGQNYFIGTDRSYILQKLFTELRILFFPLGCFYQYLQTIRLFVFNLG